MRAGRRYHVLLDHDDDTLYIEARDLARVLRCLTLCVREVRRNGDNCARNALAEDVYKRQPEQEANTEPAEESAKAAEKEKKKKKSEKIPKEDYDRLQAEFDSQDVYKRQGLALGSIEC